MTADPSRIVKIVVLVGVLVFLFLMLSSIGLRKAVQRDESQRVAVDRPRSPFDSARAWEDLEALVALGPRPPGSEPAAACRNFIRNRLRQAGVRVREQAFPGETAHGPRDMANVIGIIEGTMDGVIVIGAHYDTKYLPEIEFVGANASGAGPACLLELARAWGPSREGYTVWLCFFDGHESFAPGAAPALLGSTAWVAALEESGELAEVRAMLALSMVGDCYLSIPQDRDAPRWLVSAVWNRAFDLGYRQHFPRAAHIKTVPDDHSAFRTAGVPAAVLADVSYGGTIVDDAKNRYTANDRLDAVCQESLQAVGDVIYHAVLDLEGYLAVGPQGLP